MNCPTCNQPMKEFRKDITHSKKTGQQYTRTSYECKKDDTWVTKETPVTQQATQAEKIPASC